MSCKFKINTKLKHNQEIRDSKNVIRTFGGKLQVNNPNQTDIHPHKKIETKIKILLCSAKYKKTESKTDLIIGLVNGGSEEIIISWMIKEED